MEAYLAEVHKLQKHFLRVALEHIPRLDNKEPDDIARRASRGDPPCPGVFEERLWSLSAPPQAVEGKETEGQPPPAPRKEPPIAISTQGTAS